MKITHIRPSWFVRETRVYKQYCTITVCEECGQRGHYADQHPVSPCTQCGSRVVERVGYWKVTKPAKLFGLISKEEGQWILKGEEE